MAEPNPGTDSQTVSAPTDAPDPTGGVTAPSKPHPSVRTKTPSRTGDRVFSGLSATVAVLMAALVVVIFAFLVKSAIPALSANQANFFTTRTWSTDGDPIQFGIAALFWTTAISSVIALLIAVPLAIGIALFITQMAPRKLAGPVAFVVDLLAAVPSIIFGLWGSIVLAQAGFLEWIRSALIAVLGWIPIFSETPSWTDPSGTVFLASIVLAIMILPIMTAMCREVFDQTPRLHIEAALALGTTRWEMVKMAVLPFARPGVVAAAMLGLGRALGETMAVAMVLSPAQVITFALFHAENPNTIAANIALNYPESSGVQVNALMASGLILFVITILVNMLARWIVNRRAAFSGAD